MRNLAPYINEIFAFLKDTRNGRWQKLAFIAALFYIVFPLDLVPDFIPIFGWLDDVGIGMLASMWLAYETHRYAVNQLTAAASQPQIQTPPVPR